MKRSLVLLCWLFPGLVLAQAPTSAPSLTAPVLTNFISAPYPEAALAAGVEGVVGLLLTIDEEGKVTEVIVREPAGYGFDEAAVQAAKQFVFTPAQKDGAPVVAKIPYRYRFSLSAKGRALPSVAPLDIGEGSIPKIVLAEVTVGPSAAGSIQGEVRAAGTQKPVKAFVYVLSEPLPEGFTGETDEERAWIISHAIASGPTESEGRNAPEKFFVEGVPAGRFYVVVLPSSSYEALQYSDLLQPGEKVELNFNVSQGQKNDYGITVRAESQTPQVIKRSIEAQEILQGAGTQGDPLKAITNLPGVARAPLSTGLLIVRGSAPEDTRAEILGAWVPQLYHLTGGTAVLNAEMIEKIDFYPGAYGARFGRVNGGIIQVTPGTGDPKTLRVSGDIDLFDAGFVIRGPIEEKSSFAVSARRSYIDTLLPTAINLADTYNLADVSDFSLQTAPRSWDYEALFQYHPNQDSTLRILGLGSGDSVKLILQDDDGAGALLNGNVEGDSRQNLVLVSYNEKRNNTERQGTLAFLLFDFSGTFGPDINGGYQQNGLTARYVQDTKVWEGGVIGFGGDMFNSRITAGGITFLPPVEGDPDPPLGIEDPIAAQVDGFKWIEGGVFTELKQTLGPWTLIPGVRLERMGGTKEFLLQPRGGLTYAVNPETLLRTSVGFYSQDPIPFELDKNLGNPDLLPERSFQVATGGHHDFKRFQLDVDAFYKQLNDVVTRRGSGLTAADITNNDGEGWIWGLEVLARIPAGEKLSGWVAYTYSRSLRKDGPEEEVRSFDFDQPHVVAAVATYKLPKNFTLSGRWRFSSGTPNTEIAGSVFDADLDIYLPVPGTTNELRMPPFHQLDLRVDRLFVRNNWQLSLYLDIQNAYNHKNAESIAYNFDYTQSAFFTGLPIIPSLGLSGTYIGPAPSAPVANR